MGIDKEFCVVWVFDEAQVGVKEVGEEEGKILDKLLVLVIRGGIGCRHVCPISFSS